MISESTGIDSLYKIQDALWNRIIPLLSPSKKRKKLGHLRFDDRKAMNAIFYVLRTGCQWNRLTCSLGASSIVHDRFQEWRRVSVFRCMWIDGLSMYDKTIGIDWKWQFMNGAIT